MNLKIFLFRVCKLAFLATRDSPTWGGGGMRDGVGGEERERGLGGRDGSEEWCEFRARAGQLDEDDLVQVSLLGGGP